LSDNASQSGICVENVLKPQSDQWEFPPIELDEIAGAPKPEGSPGSNHKMVIRRQCDVRIIAMLQPSNGNVTQVGLAMLVS
jgi:hypothetical protein